MIIHHWSDALGLTPVRLRAQPVAEWQSVLSAVHVGPYVAPKSAWATLGRPHTATGSPPFDSPPPMPIPHHTGKRVQYE